MGILSGHEPVNRERGSGGDTDRLDPPPSPASRPPHRSRALRSKHLRLGAKPNPQQGLRRQQRDVVAGGPLRGGKIRALMRSELDFAL
jgi:hypothetical protein